MSSSDAATLPRTLPPGTVAWWPEACAALRRAEAAFRKAVEAEGYREVATPALDFAEVFRRALSAAEDVLFAFTDAAGEALALRPEMTTSVARLYATALADEPKPVRLYYIGQVFRQARRYSGELREFRQAGVEVFGLPAPEGEREVLRLARRLLPVLGAEGARIEVGHSGILRALLDAAGVESDRAGAISDAVHRKSPADIARATKGLPREVADGLAFLASFDACAEGGEAARALFEKARAILPFDAAREALDALAEVVQSEDGAPVAVDLGVARGLDYYTGVVFEAYLPGVAGPILGGGRYDRLASAFGADTPAIGFSIELERILRSHFSLKVGGAGVDKGESTK